MVKKKRVIIEENGELLAKKGAEILHQTIKESITQQRYFAVCISGGSTPRAMHRLWSQEPYSSQLPWDSIHFFWTDERVVPFDDPASNFGTAKSDFLGVAPIPSENLHPMPVWAGTEQGAALYQRELENFFHGFERDFPVFDLIFLGVGKDGHTASLFPGDRALEEKEKWVTAVKGGDPNLNRLTLTFTVINRAKKIVFLVSGKDKAPITKTILKNTQPPAPAQIIQPVNGDLIWLLDQEAAALLSKKDICGE